MSKLIASFLLFFVVNVILGGIMEGGGGIAATRLTAAVTDLSLTFNVRSTEGFLKADRLFIDSEECRYVNKTDTTFTVATTGRGYNETEAKAHSSGTMVYTGQASTLNGALGFNVASTDTTAGGISIPILLWNFVTKSIPKLITWDFPHLKTTEWMLFLRLVFMAISAGFSVAVALRVASALGGVAQSILRRV